MKRLLITLVFLSCSLSSYGIGNRVLTNQKQLNDAGIFFVIEKDKVNQLTQITVQVPSEFNTGKNTGTKPFSAISFIQTNEKVAHGPRLIGAPARHFPLATEKLKHGSHQATMTVHQSNIENGYIALFYMRAQSGSIATIVHIPLSSLLK